ncbi:MAG: crossover junction endodeoxyribonuclease RuvC [Gemmatimonadaceae bacterium]|nr:crossover junction endodeoxyribonuclease RuvC [Chitinophagaceae bacterium]
MQSTSKIILGIDPGTVVMGYGLIAVEGNAIRLLEMDVIKLSSHKDIYHRLEIIHNTVCRLIVEFKPQLFAIEAPFFGKNVQSMLKLGRAQGVAIAAAMQAGLPVTEYAPKKIKQSVTGNGNADKLQVWKMLQHILKIEDADLRYLDASDAIAVALCHHYQTTSVLRPGKVAVKSWADYIARNPNKVL